MRPGPDDNGDGPGRGQPRGWAFPKPFIHTFSGIYSRSRAFPYCNTNTRRGFAAAPYDPWLRLYAFSSGLISFSNASIEVSPFTRVPLMKKLGVEFTFRVLAA